MYTDESQPFSFDWLGELKAMSLGFACGAQIVQAREPVHGRLSEIVHSGCSLFNGIPSGEKSGFKVMRYHSLVIAAESLPEELVPIAWTSSFHPESIATCYDKADFRTSS
ncbi:hypothetical protein HPP92_010398 [Vanilla planifolia]|uniref:Glutamine amidotransferase domain-containing protein n=1 Tax=Vanilla planifolia TaxID=51239 RepID=A0A835QTT6_VANPL|nr:hypothetical protein HPP92_010398 [Vanilla planifolia]